MRIKNDGQYLVLLRIIVPSHAKLSFVTVRMENRATGQELGDGREIKAHKFIPEVVSSSAFDITRRRKVVRW